jgi:acyl-CoA dehydrogenase family protein 9
MASPAINKTTSPSGQHADEKHSVVQSLFFGDIDESLVFPFPYFSPEEVEIAKTMNDAFNKFAADNIDSRKFDHDSKIPPEVLKGLADLGLCGLGVPEELGGLGLNARLYSRVFQEVAGVDGSVATTLGAHQSIGFKALLNEGNKQQKEKWLPLLASGQKWAAFCLTEPGSGSDAYSIKTKAIDNKDGTYTLNGQKLWITNAGLADFYTVFAKTEHDIDGEKKEKISCFIVEKDFPGISFGEKEDKMGIRASETRAVYFDNVKVPAANILGQLGKGFVIAMNVLNTGRLSLGSGSVGAMKTIIKHAVAHANGRKQFGKTITEFGLIQEKISRMSFNCYAAESVVYLTTGSMTSGLKDYAIESAICKVFNSECLWECVDTATQIAGGCGYMREYPYERLMRDSRINLIFEGTNEILRCFIALMGIKGPGDEMKDLGKATDISKALHDPIKSLGVLSGFAKRRIGKWVGNKALSQCHLRLEEHATNYTHMVSQFSIAVENSIIKWGSKIVDREMAQKRISEMAIDLYVTIAVLSRTTAILNNKNVPEDKKEYSYLMGHLACRERHKRFNINLQAMGGLDDTNARMVSDFTAKFEGYGLEILDY